MKLIVILLSLLSLSATGQEKLFDKVHLNTRNTILLNDEINPDTVLDAQLKLAKLALLRGMQNYKIYIVIDSPGGSVADGRNFIEFAKVFSNVDTVTIFAASMAAFTVESLPGERLITNNGYLMFHRAKASIEGQVETGELESRLFSIKEEIRQLEQTVADRLGLSLFAYKLKVHDEYWLGPVRAVKDKAADRIVDIVCSQDLVEKKIEKTYDTIFGKVTIKKSACPLLRSDILSQ